MVAAILVGCSADGAADTASAGSTRPAEAASAAEPTAADRAVALRATGCFADHVQRGAGTLVGGDRVLTVAHTVAGAADIEVTLPDDRVQTATIAAIDTVRDLAVVVVDGADAPPVEEIELGAGDRGVFHRPGVALPRVFEIARSVNIGFTDIYDEGQHQRSGYELDAVVEEGDSGAGLFDAEGRLAGVIFATSRFGSDRAWATQVAEAASLLEAAASGDRTATAVDCVPTR